MTRRIAVILGGRSSENPISVASASSVIAALESSGNDVVTVADRPRRAAGSSSTAPDTLLETGPSSRLPAREVAPTLDRRRRRLPRAPRAVRRGRDGPGTARAGRSALCRCRRARLGALHGQGRLQVGAARPRHPGDREHHAAPRRRAAEPVRLPVLRQAGSARLERRDHEGTRRRGAARRRRGSRSSTTRRCSWSGSSTGTEIEVGVLGNREPIASLPGEIVVTHNEWYDFEAKYDDGEMDLIVPARVNEAQLERAQELAVRAFIATDCEGMARADLFVREDGEVLVNELNTIPGFTSTSVYARLFEDSGMPYAELLDRLADLAVERFERRQLRSSSETVLEPVAPASSCGIPCAERGGRAGVRRVAGGDAARRRRRLRPGAAEVVVPAPPDPARVPRPRLERARDRGVPHPGQLRRAQPADPGGLRVGRRDLAALLRGRQPARRTELHQLVRARRRCVPLPLLDRLRPAATRSRGRRGRSTCCRATRSARHRPAASSSASYPSGRARG